MIMFVLAGHWTTKKLGAMDSTPINALVIDAKVVEVLHTSSDPEMRINIDEVGLIYNVNTHGMFGGCDEKWFSGVHSKFNRR